MWVGGERGVVAVAICVEGKPMCSSDGNLTCGKSKKEVAAFQVCLF